MKNQALSDAVSAYNTFLEHLSDAHGMAAMGNSALEEMVLFDLLEPAHALGRRLLAVSTAVSGEPPVNEN